MVPLWFESGKNTFFFISPKKFFKKVKNHDLLYFSLQALG